MTRYLGSSGSTRAQRSSDTRQFGAYDSGRDAAALANMAKLRCSEAAFQACDRALQVFGGMGYAREFHVERYWREARLLRIAPISNEMVKNFVAHHMLKLPRSY